MADLDIEGFLGHDPNGGGGDRGKFLRGWKKRKPSEVNIWLHTKVMFSSIWQHNLQRVVTRKDKESGEEKQEIWGNSWVCWEPEAVLSHRKRDYNTGERETPFTICPVCKMVEWVRMRVKDGSLNPEDEVFKYFTPDGKHEQVLHAAGLYNGLDDDRFSAEQRKAIADAGIKLSLAWKENCNSKCNYLFCVVDHDHPEDGVQVAIETNLLGDKTKAVIRRKRKKNGEDSDWNPLATPYAFCWEYHESAKKFDEKYDADDRPKLKLTADIEALITGDPPDNLDRIKAPGRLRELRDQFERYALIEMPWDEFFADAEAKEKELKDDATDFPYGANDDDAGEVDPDAIAKADAAMQAAAAANTTKAPPAKPAEKPKPASTQAKAPAAATKPAAAAPKPSTEKPPESAAEAQQPAAAAATGGRRKIEAKPKFEPVMIKCDDCPEKLREDQEQCHGCGATYGVDDDIKAKYKDAPPLPKPDAGTHGDKIKF